MGAYQDYMQLKRSGKWAPSLDLPNPPEKKEIEIPNSKMAEAIRNTEAAMDKYLGPEESIIPKTRMEEISENPGATHRWINTILILIALGWLFYTTPTPQKPDPELQKTAMVVQNLRKELAAERSKPQIAPPKAKIARAP